MPSVMSILIRLRSVSILLKIWFSLADGTAVLMVPLNVPLISKRGTAILLIPISISSSSLINFNIKRNNDNFIFLKGGKSENSVCAECSVILSEQSAIDMETFKRFIEQSGLEYKISKKVLNVILLYMAEQLMVLTLNAV